MQTLLIKNDRQAPKKECVRSFFVLNIVFANVLKALSLNGNVIATETFDEGFTVFENNRASSISLVEGKTE